MPPKYFKKVGEEGFRKHPIGTGCVKFVEWKMDDYVITERNDEYWGGPIAWERVIFKPYPELSVRIAALLAGEIDLCTHIPVDQAERIRKSGVARIEKALYTGVYAYFCGVINPPKVMSDKVFRQAISLAIDRETICKKLWGGYAKVPNDIYSPGIIGHEPNNPPLPYDPKKAKELIAKSGYKGEEIPVMTTVGYVTNDKELTELVASMLTEVGINAKIKLIEASMRRQFQKSRSIAGLWVSHPMDSILDPDGMWWRLMMPGATYGYWRNPEWDRLMQEAQTSTDPEKRDKLYKKASKIFLDENPWIIMIWPEELFGVSNRVDWKARGDDFIQVFEMKIR